MYKPIYYSRPASLEYSTAAGSMPKERAVIAPLPQNTALHRFDPRAVGRMEATRERLEKAERELEESRERVVSLERSLADTNAANEQRVREVADEMKDYKCVYCILFSTVLLLFNGRKCSDITIYF